MAIWLQQKEDTLKAGGHVFYPQGQTPATQKQNPTSSQASQYRVLCSISMCHKYVLYHLCGHSAQNTLIPCSPTIISSVDSKVRDGRADHLFSRDHRPIRQCSDATEKIHILPELCDFCFKKGIVGEYLNRNPWAVADVLRAWKKSIREGSVREQRRMSVAGREVQKFGIIGDDEKVKEAESMNFISLQAVRSDKSAGASTVFDGKDTCRSESTHTSRTEQVSQDGSPSLKIAAVKGVLGVVPKSELKKRSKLPRIA